MYLAGDTKEIYYSLNKNKFLVYIIHPAARRALY